MKEWGKSVAKLAYKKKADIPKDAFCILWLLLQCLLWKVPGTTILPFLFPLKWKIAIYQVHKLFTIRTAAYDVAATLGEWDSAMMFFIRGVTVLWDSTYKRKDIPERWASKNLNHYMFSNLFNANFENSGSFREFPVQHVPNYGVMSCDITSTLPNSQILGRTIFPHQHPPFKFCSDKPRSNKSVDFWYFRISPWGQCRTYVNYGCAHIQVVYELQPHKQTCRPSHTRTDITYIKLHVLLRCISIQY